MIEPRRRYAVPFGVLFALITAGCGGDVTLPGDGEAANLEIVSGDEQIAPAGASLPAPVVVRVSDTQDRPVANQDVTFVVESGSGQVAPATVKTSATGEASAAWTLGTGVGDQLLRVRTARGGSTTPLEVTFGATAIAGTGSILVGVRGDDQTGPVSSALADSLVVRATDALGNPVADVEVTWSVTGGGSINPVTVRTDVDGLAGAERVLGPTAGPVAARATVAGFNGSPVTFSHTAVPANPTALVRVSGDDQTAPGGFEVAGDLVVRLEDDNGNGIGGRQVTWVVPASAGSVTTINSVTNVNGLAVTRWTLPSTVGTYTINAVFSGLPPVPFSATATADQPTTVALVSGNNQSAAVGTQVPSPLVVRVTDASDNPVPNVSVTWTAGVGGSVSDVTTATNSAGLAQVQRTLGLLPGPYTTTAEVDGLTGSPVTFTSTATVGPPAKLAIVTQPGSPTTSGTAFVPVPVIQVQDLVGNPVSQGGIAVTASISSGQAGATLTNEDRNTNGNGRVTFSNLQITGPPDNDYVLTFTASVGGNPLLPVSSQQFTVVAGGATRIVIQTQPSATAQVAQIFPQQPVVEVVDATGNPVAGNRTITVAIEDGAGTLGGTLTATTGGGSTATFSGLRITGAVGVRTLLFSSGALTPVESGDVNITLGPPSSLAIQAGDNQTALAGDAVAVDPAVIVTDAGGNPVSGVDVAFAVTAGNGTVIPTTVTTGANGIATVTSWTLGNAGANTMVASVPSAPGLGTETFDATATAVNQAPTAQADGYAVDEDQTLDVNAANGVLTNDNDNDGDDLTAVLDQGPSNAQAFQLNADGSFSYTPAADFNGSDSFTYHAFDGQAQSGVVTVTITVNPVNDDPGFQAGPNQQVSSLSTMLTGVSVPAWATGIDPGPPDEDAQTVSFQTTTDNDAAFIDLPQVSADGTLTYRPQLTVIQTAVSVTVTALDSGGAQSAPQNFTITIDP